MSQNPMPLTFYADKVNSQFTKSQSQYVDLSSRLDSILDEDWKESIVSDVLISFKQRYSNLKSWDQLSFCRALSTTFDLIDIDVTLQRLGDLRHLCNILRHFDPIKVMPICVYEDEMRPGRYVCWDGQHTALTLLIIATKYLKLNPADLSIPIVIYASHQKSDMRNCFITLNGEGKKPLDHIDIIHQKIFGVRTDNSQNKEWRLVEKKYQMLEKNKIFLTHDKFGDVHEGGAYSRVNEFNNTNYDIKVTDYFAKYFFKICQASRPVEPKESWMLYDFFNLCVNQNITVDNDYIAGVAESLKVVGNNDFSSMALWHRAKECYQEWWKHNKPNPDGTILGISYAEEPIAITFLIAQIAKNFDGKLPRYSPHFTVNPGDLF